MAEPTKDKENENETSLFAGLGGLDDMGGFGSIFRFVSQALSSLFSGNFLGGLFGDGNALGKLFGGLFGDQDDDPAQNSEKTARFGARSTPGLLQRGRTAVTSAVTQGWDSLLDFIGLHESNGDYNVAFGGKQVDFTHMSIRSVLAWQKSYVDAGSPSSAVGKFQIIQDTLRDSAHEMNLTGDELFDAEMQTRVAMHLLRKRGLGQFERGEMSLREFGRRISQEWASMPKDKSGESYYAKDGLNKASAKPEELRGVLTQARIEQRSATDQPGASLERTPSLTGLFRNILAPSPATAAPLPQPRTPLSAPIPSLQ